MNSPLKTYNLEPQRKILLHPAPYTLHELYDRYAGMLLGHLSETVKDHQQAEQHLINIFNTIPDYLNEAGTEGINNWCQLQRFANRHLFNSFKTITDEQDKPALKNEGNKNPFLKLMTEEQKLIFCAIYYHGKTTVQLSEQLTKTEDYIRRVLKEAFTIIRKRA